jgi:hypothetical protein
MHIAAKPTGASQPPTLASTEASFPFNLSDSVDLG